MNSTTNPTPPASPPVLWKVYTAFLVPMIISNILPARVMDCAPAHDPAQMLVRLDLGGTTILSRITRRSLHLLNIRPDQIVYAQVKSVALMR